MNTVVIYKSKYGSTRTYAEWISKELECEIYDAKNIKADDLLKYDAIISLGNNNSIYKYFKSALVGFSNFIPPVFFV